jgi:hypothetical protein
MPKPAFTSQSHPFADVPVENPGQLGGIETSVLDNGPGRGVRIAWVNTGGGLRYKVVIDRGLDIADAEFLGQSLTWHSLTGITAHLALTLHYEWVHFLVHTRVGFAQRGLELRQHALVFLPVGLEEPLQRVERELLNRHDGQRARLAASPSSRRRCASGRPRVRHSHPPSHRRAVEPLESQPVCVDNVAMQKQATRLIAVLKIGNR